MSTPSNSTPPASRFIRANGIRHHYLEWGGADADMDTNANAAPLLLLWK